MSRGLGFPSRPVLVGSHGLLSPCSSLFVTEEAAADARATVLADLYVFPLLSSDGPNAETGHMPDVLAAERVTAAAKVPNEASWTIALRLAAEPCAGAPLFCVRLRIAAAASEVADHCN